MVIKEGLTTQPGGDALNLAEGSGEGSGSAGGTTSSGQPAGKPVLTPQQLLAENEKLRDEVAGLEKVKGQLGQKLEGYEVLKETVEPIWDEILDLREKKLKGSEQSQAQDELREQLSQSGLPPKVVEMLSTVIDLVPTLQKRQTALEAKQDLQDYFEKNPDKKDLKPKMDELISNIRTGKVKDIDIIALAARGSNLSSAVDQVIAGMSVDELDRKKAALALSHRSGSSAPPPEKVPEQNWKTEKDKLLVRAKQKSTFPGA